MNRPALNWLLGNYEMEMAVEKMLQISEQSGCAFEKLSLGPHEFEGSDTHGSELSGFCNLLYRELMEPHTYYNRYFCPSRKLIDIMRKRACWKDMPYPPTPEERMEELTKFMKGRQ